PTMPSTDIYTLSLHDALPIYSRSLALQVSDKGWVILLFWPGVLINLIQLGNFMLYELGALPIICKFLIESRACRLDFFKIITFEMNDPFGKVDYIHLGIYQISKGFSLSRKHDICLCWLLNYSMKRKLSIGNLCR